MSATTAVRWAKSLAPLLATLVLTGCGAEDLSPQGVADAATKTQREGTSRVSFKGRVEGPGLPSAVSFGGNGVLDNSKRRGRLTTEGPGPAGGRLKFEQVIDGLVIYMRGGVFNQLLDQRGKEWLKIDLEKAGKGLGIDVGQLNQAAGDPSESLRYLRAASGEIETVGEEQVRGTNTTRYRAKVDIRRYPKLVPADERPRAEASAKRLIELNGGSTIPTEVWIDEQGLIRRQRITSSFPSPQGGRAKVTQDIELYDFGTPVDVEIPPDDEVLDGTELGTRGARDLQRQRP